MGGGCGCEASFTLLQASHIRLAYQTKHLILLQLTILQEDVPNIVHYRWISVLERQEMNNIVVKGML